MIFILDNNITLESLHPETAQMLIKLLTMINPEYSEASKRGRTTQGIKQYLCFYESMGNQLICRTVAENNSNGITLVLSDRKAHCQALKGFLFNGHCIHAEVLTGSTSPKERKRIITALKGDKCKYLIATGQLIGEGFDLPGISTVFLTTPVKFSERLIQYIGRALRPAPCKDKAVIFDFVDSENPIFKASAKSRKRTDQNERIEA